MRLILATAIAATATTLAGACAAANSTVAVGNPSGTTTALVAPTRQLQTVTTAPTNLVVAGATNLTPASCGPVYTPPAGKAIVVTEVTYGIVAGSASIGEVLLGQASCSTSYDFVVTSQQVETQSHTFPTGLPMANVYINNNTNGQVQVTISGYLIPATQLPSEPPEFHGLIKGMVSP